jgi:hypothetical protein
MDDEIEAATVKEIRIKTMKFEALREEDQTREKTKTTITRYQVLTQTPGRSISQDFPETSGEPVALVMEFSSQDGRARVTREDTSGIQQKRFRAFFTLQRYESWECEAESTYGVQMEIHPDVAEAYENAVILCIPEPTAPNQYFEPFPRARCHTKWELKRY